MKWTEVRFHISNGQESMVNEAFDLAGITAYAIASRDDGDLDVLLYGQDGAVDHVALEVLNNLGLQPESATDWDEADLYALANPEAAVSIADNTWIVVPNSDTTALPSDAITIVIPPGPAFGDGRHPTTRLCAQFLLSLDLTGKRVLDVGCGSGALGILAAKRGAALVDYCDIDPDSVRLTEEACRLNGTPARHIWESDLLEAVSDGPYDIIIGNIYADLVANLLLDERFPELLPSGHCVVSGISHKKRDLVDEVLEDAGCTLQAEAREAWWDGLLLRR